MDKIEVFNPAYFHEYSEKKKIEKKKSSKKTSFSKVLENSEKSIEEIAFSSSLNVEKKPLDEMLDEIHELGEQLKRNAKFEIIKKYKKAIGNFLKIVLSSAYGLEEKLSGANILKRKKFTLIKIINSKMENLATGILQNQLSQLAILEKVDEINGLLVNLLS